MAAIATTITDRQGKPIARLGHPSKAAWNYGNQDVYAPTGPTRKGDRVGYTVTIGGSEGGHVVLLTDDQERVTSYPTGSADASSPGLRMARDHAFATFMIHIEAARRRNATDHREYLREWFRSLTGSPEASARVRVRGLKTAEGSTDAVYRVTLPLGTANHLGLRAGRKGRDRVAASLSRHLGRRVLVSSVTTAYSLVHVVLTIPALGGPAFDVVADGA